MKRSESVGKLMVALSKAQGEMAGAAKSAVNPFFKSRYADLSSVIDAIKAPFAKHGLAYSQFARVVVTDQSKMVEVETHIFYGDEFVSEVLTFPVEKYDAQGLGKLITYIKRYSLQAMVGVPSEDDDGNDATGKPPPSQQSHDPSVRDAALRKLNPAVPHGKDALDAAYKGLSEEERKSVAGDIKGLQNTASQVVIETTTVKEWREKLAKADPDTVSPIQLNDWAKELKSIKDKDSRIAVFDLVKQFAARVDFYFDKESLAFVHKEPVDA